MIYATSHKHAEGQCTVVFRIFFWREGIDYGKRTIPFAE